MSKTIVWRPGYAAANVRPTTAQRGTPLDGQPLAGQEVGSIPDTLTVAEIGDVVKQVGAWNGDCTIVFDDTDAACDIPAGIILPGYGFLPNGSIARSGVPLLKLKGGGPAARTAVHILDTAQILGVASMQDLSFICDAITVRPFGDMGSELTLRAVAIANAAGTLLTCMRTLDSSSMHLNTDDTVVFDNGAKVTLPILLVGSTGADPGSSLTIRSSMGLTVGTNAVKAAAPGTVTVEHYHDPSTAANYLLTQCPLLVAVTDQPAFPAGSGAAGTYTPSVSGDWTGADPTTIQEALDRIAAALGPIA